MKYLEEDVQAETQALDDAIRTVENLNDGIARAEKVRPWLSNYRSQYFRWLFVWCREAERQKCNKEECTWCDQRLINLWVSSATQELHDNQAREQQLKRQHENIVGKLARVESVHKQHSGDTEETRRRLRQVSLVSFSTH
jgi:hypothetical protein